MKTITIGRGDGADIIIDNEMISRRHAILKISTFGKMEIVDMGRNGTYVNGIKLRPNVPFPITRKDVVRFADQDSPFKLDWSVIPDNSKKFKIAIAALIGILAIILLVVLIRSCSSEEEKTSAPTYIETAPAQSPTENASAVPAPESDMKDGVTEDNREKEKEEKDNKEEAKRQKDLEGKTIQDLFPQRPAKKDANPNPDSKKKSNEPVKPSNVKAKKNGAGAGKGSGNNAEKGSGDNKTVIM